MGVVNVYMYERVYAEISSVWWEGQFGKYFVYWLREQKYSRFLLYTLNGYCDSFYYNNNDATIKKMYPSHYIAQPTSLCMYGCTPRRSPPTNPPNAHHTHRNHRRRRRRLSFNADSTTISIIIIIIIREGVVEGGFREPVL